MEKKICPRCNIEKFKKIFKTNIPNIKTVIVIEDKSSNDFMKRKIKNKNDKIYYEKKWRKIITKTK